MKGDLSEMSSRKSRKIQVCSTLALAGLGLAAVLAGTGPASAAGTVGVEQYRPAVHFRPKLNWMNDPIGMV
jgi:levanase